MKTEYGRYILFTSIFLFVAWTLSCSGRSGQSSSQGAATNQVSPSAEEFSSQLIKFISPGEDSEYKLGDEISISVAPLKENGSFDSVKIYFDGTNVAVMKSSPWNYTIPPGMTGTTGRKSVKTVAYSGDKIQSLARFVVIYSNSRPKRYSYKIIRTYPHDPEAFTQGLFYYKGMLYEGTGQEAGSSLREVELQTGRVVRQHNLDPSLFGEGITLYGTRIYQVTWTNKVGFVYDLYTFDVLNKIYYSTQGWGLTTIGNRIVMSDGTNVLYFFEPEMFTVVSRLEVYDNQKKVDQLNELEYIDGEIWANIWQTDLIARINPVSGKVNSYVDLSSIFPQEKRREVNADVLNGIAYDAGKKRIFITGKRWPKLYEIEVTE
jgi:glutamine cyclotransferase